METEKSSYTLPDGSSLEVSIFSYVNSFKRKRYGDNLEKNAKQRTTDSNSFQRETTLMSMNKFFHFARLVLHDLELRNYCSGQT